MNKPLYIKLKPGSVVESDELEGNHGVIYDYDAEGNVVGIEILDYESLSINREEVENLKWDIKSGATLERNGEEFLDEVAERRKDTNFIPAEFESVDDVGEIVERIEKYSRSVEDIDHDRRYIRNLDDALERIAYLERNLPEGEKSLIGGPLGTETVCEFIEENLTWTPLADEEEYPPV